MAKLVAIVAVCTLPALLLITQMFSDQGPLAHSTQVAVWAGVSQLLGFVAGGWLASHQAAATRKAIAAVSIVVVVYITIAAVIDLLTASRSIEVPYWVSAYVVEAFLMFVLGAIGAGLGSMGRRKRSAAA
jgi:hypothetical protein